MVSHRLDLGAGRASEEQTTSTYTLVDRLQCTNDGNRIKIKFPLATLCVFSCDVSQD